MNNSLMRRKIMRQTESLNEFIVIQYETKCDKRRTNFIYFNEEIVMNRRHAQAHHNVLTISPKKALVN